jgi:hypothetical protein
MQLRLFHARLMQDGVIKAGTRVKPASL